METEADQPRKHEDQKEQQKPTKHGEPALIENVMDLLERNLPKEEGVPEEDNADSENK